MNPARIRLPGHPDATCDAVAEAIVDEYVRRDSAARVSLSVAGGRGALFVSGDVKSSADFDVGQVISRALGALGIASGIEPFVSLEHVVGERVALFIQGTESPTVVSGYATDETPDMIPKSCELARRVAQALEEKRTTDENWFWLGADGEVFVSDHVSIRVEHGTKPISEVRDDIARLVSGIAERKPVRVNELGADESRGLANVMGASGRETHPYGFSLPSSPSGIGLDPARTEKAGTWLVRQAARDLVRRGARAALVRATYAPGERMPSHVSARDEKGKDVSKDIARATLALDRVMTEWWRPNLSVDAARWGFAGVAGLPWEE